MLIRANKKHKNNVSIEDVLGRDDEDNEITVADLSYDDVEDVQCQAENKNKAEILDIALKKYLNDREYQIISMRYGLKDTAALPQREVADKLGISRSYISRIEKKAISILKQNINRDEFM
jgi:RNA polymerase sporulation-specific sigma factor